MKIVTQAAAVRQWLAVAPRPCGFVPTMGALHAGHLRLVDVARAGCKTVVASLFVNPMQFGPNEDYERYPRDLDADSALFEGAGADLLFAPEPAQMYPPGFSTTVDVGELGTRYEGAARPTHFRGVATVVAKLLNIVAPDVLYLGQKDAQQAAVVAKMLRDLNFTTQLEIVETVREADGIALSSRNAYLSAQERAAAPSLHRALQTMAQALRSGSVAGEARDGAARELDPLAQLEYLDVVDAQSFEPIERLRPPAFVIGAAKLGRTRLIDNLWIK